MTRLGTIDMLLVKALFEKQGEAGYVLDFSNPRMAEFFVNELGVDIYDDAYAKYGTSKFNRLKCYLQTVEPKVAARALTALWDYREAVRMRDGADEKVPDARTRLLDLVRRLDGGKSPESQPAQKPRVDKTLLEKLSHELLAVSQIQPPQKRGFVFEKFLKDLFDAYGMTPRGSFRLVGEQIDGSFALSDQPYLLEARWQNAKTDAADLRAFNAKAEDKADWTRGLFLSQSGFTDDGLAAFGRGKRLICMDGLDLFDTLRRGLHLQDVLLAKVRRAGEHGTPFVRVRDLFPE
jgi:hypothetical protein